MAWFKCLMRGEHFPGQLADHDGRFGFYVARFVEAGDANQAEIAALQKLRDEPRLAPPPGYAPTGQAKVFFEEIEELAADRVPPTQPGFAWYPMKVAEV